MNSEDYIKKYAKKHKITIAKAKQLLTKRSSLPRFSPFVENHDISIRKIRGQLYAFKGNKVLNDSTLREITDGKYYVYVNGKLYKHLNQPVLVSYEPEPFIIPAPELQEEPYTYPAVPHPTPERPRVPQRPLQVPTESKALYKEKKFAQELIKQYQELEGRQYESPKKVETKKILADKLLNAFYNLSSNPDFASSPNMQTLSERIQSSYFTLSAPPSTRKKYIQNVQSIIESESPDKERLIQEVQHEFFTIPPPEF